MNHIELPFWLRSTLFQGAENDEGENESSDEGENEDEGSEEEENEEGSGSESNSSTDDTAQLKKALADERRLRRKAEREAKRATRQANSEEEQKNLEAVQQNLTVEQEKTRRLAERLRNDRRDSAILEEARRQGFIDPTDALIDSVRSSVDVDQDDEDPSDIDVDFDSVKTAVTSLATKKKHLVGTPGDGEPSGGRFNSKKKTSSANKKDAEYAEQYPSLR